MFLKYFLIGALAFSSSLLVAMEKTSDEQSANIKLLFCGHCTRSALLCSFKYCDACRKNGISFPYCSPECQRADWPRHKVDCKNKSVNIVSEEERLKNLLEISSQSIEWPKKEELGGNYTKEEIDPVINGLKEYGYCYRQLLLINEIVSCQIRKDAAGVLKNSRMYLLATEDFLMKEFPDYDDDTANTQMCKALLAGLRSPQTQNLASFLKNFEPFRDRGTFFLKKGYSPEVEDALQRLRIKIIDQFSHMQWSHSEAAHFIWAYIWLCSFNCLESKRNDACIQAIDANDSKALISCLKAYEIIEQHLTDEDFLDYCDEHNITLEKLREVLVAKEPIEFHLIAGIENEDLIKSSLYVFDGLANNFKTWTFNYARSYYEICLQETPQSYMNKEKDQDEYEVRKEYCSYCTKQETDGRFKVCGACKNKNVHYCSELCLHADETRHKPTCITSIVNLKDENLRIQTAREKLHTILEQRLKTAENTKISKRDRETIAQGLLARGAYYRASLRENCIHMLAHNDEKNLLHHLQLLKEATAPRMLTLYPEPNLDYLSRLAEKIDTLEFFKQRIGDAEEQVGPNFFTRHFITLLKVLQPHRSQGTLYRNMRYSDQACTLLEQLRRNLIQEYFDDAWESRDRLWLMWGYATLCSIPCLVPKSERLLQKAIMTHNASFMIGCIDQKALLKHALKNNEAFCAMLSDKVCSPEEMGQLLEKHVIGAMNLEIPYMIQNRLARSPFAYLAENSERILLALATAYHKACQNLSK